MSCVQKEVAEFSCICERHIGTQSGGMDQVGFAKTFFSSVVICCFCHFLTCLWYVGVIWFVFLVSYLLLIRFTSLSLCCNSKSAIEHQQKLD